MTRAVYKYELEKLLGDQYLDLPINHQILDVQIQHGKIVLWVLVDPTMSTSKVHFSIYWTGGNITHLCLQHLKTVQDSIGLVWHIFLNEE